MKRSKAITLFLLVASLAGCAGASDYRKSGFRSFDSSYQATKPDLGTDGFREQVILEDTRIRILNQQQLLYIDPKSNSARHSVRGLATPPNQITIVGKVVNGKIIVDQAILGHELLHILHFQHPDKFHDPDQLDKEGL